jgi:hypothetical protein
VQIADLGIGIDDPFAVKRHLQPEGPVHSGMLRPHVQDLRVGPRAGPG